MSLQKQIALRTKRRAFRVRNRLKNKSELPRVSVFRSARHIYAQVIDDNAQKTLVSFSSLNLEKVSGDKKDIAKQVGMELGKIATSKGVSSVFFDRGQYLYHGRVAALAQGLREGGLKF